jgi:hypothetical protein
LGDRGIGQASEGDLRYAIDTANANTDAANQVVFMPGLTGTITLRGDPLIITKDLEIDGPGADQLTVSGNHLSQVFTIPHGDGTSHVAIADLTIADGLFTKIDDSLYGGGGILSASASLTLSRCIIVGNASVGEPPNDLFGHGGGIYNVDGMLTLNACTVTGNHADGEGSGIINTGAMTLIDTTVAGNTAGSSGGGIFNFAAHMGDQSFVIDSVITGNTAPSGGGVFTGSEDLTIEGTTISSNSAQVGGGLYLGYGAATIVNSTIANNNAELFGGGFFGDVYFVATITGSTFSGNVGGSGGAIAESNKGDVHLTNCTISDNAAYAGGGVLMGYSTYLELTSCTLAGNRATFSGGGIANSGPNRVVMRNSIVASNQTMQDSPDVYGPVISLGYNLIGQADGSIGWGSHDLTGSNAAPLDARLGPLEDNGGPTLTQGLQSDSPARGAGDPTLLNTDDQRGTRREVYYDTDIGAVQELPLSRFRVSGPAQIVAGQPFIISVTALDRYGNVANAYTDVTVFLSPDPAAELPAPYTFVPNDRGRQTFTVTLNTVGSQSIRVAHWTQDWWGDLSVEVDGAVGSFGVADSPSGPALAMLAPAPLLPPEQGRLLNGDPGSLRTASYPATGRTEPLAGPLGVARTAEAHFQVFLLPLDDRFALGPMTGDANGS